MIETQQKKEPATPGLKTVVGKKNVVTEPSGTEAILDVRDVTIKYSGKPAVDSVSFSVLENHITAIIGPSGCGKSTLIRAFNRMNDFIPAAAQEGEILYRGRDICGKEVDPVELRRQIGMVFQKPNPFPKSIFDNVAFGLRINGYQGNLSEAVESSLKRAALWDEVKDRLGRSALALSGGQQQRLCIARAIAIQPAVILMDEPCSALDPVATLKIEDLMGSLTEEYTIVIVTHNMQQAARVSNFTAFMTMEDDRAGVLIEYGKTSDIFSNPKDKRTEDYITGRFG